MTLNLKGEGEKPNFATTLEVVVSPPVQTGATTLEGAKMVPPVPTFATLEVVPPMTLNLKSEEMPSHVTTMDGPDSDAAACPTATNSLGPMGPTNPTINTGEDSPKTSSRPTKTNAEEMPTRPGTSAETPTYPMLPPTRATSSAWLPHPLLRPSHCRVPHVSPALL